MLRGPLGNNKYKPKFSGHDTFPFRYAWLTKLVHYLEDGNKKKIKEFEQNKLKTISDFGVGLNMVKSIRHWSIATRICDKDFNLTDFGKMIFSKTKSFDPYLERSETLWLLHWMLASDPMLTTWYYIFNYHPSIIINKEKLANELVSIGKFSKWRGMSTNTLKRDVDCFVRSYVAPNSSSVYTAEDVLECPLTELNLIRKVYGNALNAKRDFQDSIPNELFLRAIDNLRKFEGITANTITVETLLNSPYSPGTNFLLSREALTEKLENISEISENSIELDQSSGLAQIIIKDDKFKNSTA